MKMLYFPMRREKEIERGTEIEIENENEQGIWSRRDAFILYTVYLRAGTATVAAAVPIAVTAAAEAAVAAEAVAVEVC